jgi:hypothetical protein
MVHTSSNSSTSVRRRSTFFAAPPLPSSSKKGMMEGQDQEGNTATASEVPTLALDSSEVSHSRTSSETDVLVGGMPFDEGPLKSDSDIVDPPSFSSFNLKSEIPTSRCTEELGLQGQAPRTNTNTNTNSTAIFTRQNSLPPMPPPQLQSYSNTSSQKEQGRGQLQQHFLQGINVESCQNLLSIPDPPTPGKQKVNRRRQSTPMLRPFHDLTSKNHHNIQTQSHTHADDSKVSQRSKPKRPRKSFSHIPLSVPNSNDLDQPQSQSSRHAQEENDTNTSAETATCLPFAVAQAATTETLQFDHDNDDNDNNNSDASVTKRRKKRQSIVLPSDTTTGTQEYFSTFMAYKKAPPGSTSPQEQEQEQRPSVHVPATMEHCPTVTSQDLQELRKLVRSYTSLSPDSRSNCKEIKLIRERTGYVMTPPVTCSDNLQLNVDFANDNLNQGKQSIKACKMDLLVRLGPKLQRMDEKKLEQVQKSQRATECFVERNRGRYYYYHLSNNRVVASDEYEQRYLHMLQDTHEICSPAWAQHFQKVQVLHEHERELSNKNDPAPRASLSNECADQEYLEIPVDHDDDGTSGDESMDLCDTSTSFVQGEDFIDDYTDVNPCNNNKGDDEGQEIALDDQGDIHLSPSNIEAAVRVQVASPGASASGDSSVLPLPSRDEESSDPEIACAEQKLWTAIDQALEEYSRDVLAIQTAQQIKIGMIPAKVLTLT